MNTSFVRALRATPTPLIFALSLLIAVALLWTQDALDDVGPALRHADLWQITAGFALYLGGIILLCVRWNLLIVMTGGRSDPLLAGEAFVTSVAINYAAPLSLAIPSRALLTRRALGLSNTETAGLSFWEVAADLVVLAAGSLLWLALGGWDASLFDGARDHVMWGVVTGLFAVAGVVLAISRVRKLRRLLVSLYSRVSPALAYPARNPGQAARAIAVTVIFWLTQGAVMWLLVEAIDDETPSITLLLGLLSMPVLIGMLSPIPGGAGVREALMIAVAGVHGANEAAILLAAVTYRIALFTALPVMYFAIRLLLRGRNEERGTMSPETDPGTGHSSGGERDTD